MATDVNWDELRATLRLEMIDGEPAGSDAARRALELILGEEILRQSVDYYVALRPACELVRSVLWLLRPWSAMIRCRELSQLPNEIETRRSAVELLRVVADGRALPWVSEFLDDEDAGIQQWGIGVLDQLLYSHLVEPEEAEEVSKEPRATRMKLFATALNSSKAIFGIGGKAECDTAFAAFWSIRLKKPANLCRLNFRL